MTDNAVPATTDRCCMCGEPCDDDTGAWINGVFEPMCLECE